MFSLADAQATLAQKWNISEDVSFEYTGLTFELGYTVSDYITNTATDPKMARVNVFDQGCQEDGVYIYANDTSGIDGITLDDTAINHGNSDADLEVDTTDFPGTATVGSGENMDRLVTVNITIDSEKISENSLLYSEDTAGSQVSAEIRFCVRFGLHTKSATSVEVNFLETLVTLNVDLTDGFEIGSIAVEPRDRLVRTANQVYLVKAFLCDADNKLKPAGDPINQGTVVRVCVTPDDDAVADGIKMRSIDDFTWSRTLPTAVNQPAIIGRNKVARNDLTTLDGNPGDLIIAFETILFAAFYTTAGAVAGSGVASMQFGTVNNGPNPSRRGLRGEEEERMLQDDEAAAAAEFELDFDVTQATPYGTSGAASFGVVASAVASMVIATLM
jgi:hypothetical protein